MKIKKVNELNENDIETNDKDTKIKKVLMQLSIEQLEVYLEKRKNERGCICKDRMDQYKNSKDVWICGDCDLPIKQ